jgi:hypothetical protein
VKIVVNHLTRMQQGYICVSGLKLGTCHHVRPILSGNRLSTSLLRRNGGPFDMAVIVDLGTVKPHPQNPEVEDHIFDPTKATAIGTLISSKFWTLLTQVAERKLVSIFGEDLTIRGTKSCGVDVGKGVASLGCLIPSSPPEIYLKQREGKPDQIRMCVGDGCFELDLGVTDIRLYCDDHQTPNKRLVKNIADRIRDEKAVILSVGLTRPFTSLSGFPPIHWLQLNNIHLKSDPTWRLE